MARKRIHLARARRAAGYTQEDLAHVLGVDRSTVGRWEGGETEPQAWMQPKLARALGVSRTELRAMLTSEDERRSPPASAPAGEFDPDRQRHLAAALTDAHRYLDVSVVDYFRRQFDMCTATDGTHGSARALPTVLGIVEVVQQHAREAKPEVRRHLLQVGARGAEFVGWLYREGARPDRSLYWRDRAAEWALESGDWPMLGYILLKKSQSAWDERDGAQMLTLAQAAQEGPWNLPSLVHAEAAQQEARGLAMVGERIDVVEQKLDAARAWFDAAGDEERADGALGAGYSERLLQVQTAICYCEVGQPARAVELYRDCLAGDVFSYRDRGFFLSLLALALLQAGEPEEACERAWAALAIAGRTDSKRTKRELNRLCGGLGAWGSHRSDVRALGEAVRTTCS
ncbi:hypothetical protein BJF90_17995 [Pseudonocardia sp. CNS-004]|nr:hypothetical protein BJF90_17995 [Pseudonocardia sp. CNS-004]